MLSNTINIFILDGSNEHRWVYIYICTCIFVYICHPFLLRIRLKGVKFPHKPKINSFFYFLFMWEFHSFKSDSQKKGMTNFVFTGVRREASEGTLVRNQDKNLKGWIEWERCYSRELGGFKGVAAVALRRANQNRIKPDRQEQHPRNCWINKKKIYK